MLNIRASEKCKHEMLQYIYKSFLENKQNKTLPNVPLNKYDIDFKTQPY